MKNITLSAQEDLIEKARMIAISKNTSLNVMFREWLKELIVVNLAAVTKIKSRLYGRRQVMLGLVENLVENK